MPYLEDGETWSTDFDIYEEGMAENKPGHKKFSQYTLPSWAKHPLSHPFNGVVLGPDAYYHMAGDGFLNPMNWSIAHVACRFGDLDLLEMCSSEELDWQTIEGHSPAQYCVQHATPWCLQWLVEKGADTTSPDFQNLTPEDHIWRNPRLHQQEMEWLFKALQGELDEKNNNKAQEYRMMKHRTHGADQEVQKSLDRDMKKLRKYWFGTTDYQLPYPIPTPEELEMLPLDLPSSKVKRMEKKKPPNPVALLFPGQGSQYLGMLKDDCNRPTIKEYLDRATEILGWDPKDLCLNGPEDKLSETRYCQPIMFIAGMAALEKLRDSKADYVDNPMAVAGLSLGEYTAICAAGVLDFEDCLRLVKARAEAMQKATDLTPQAMCSIAGLDRAKVDMLCEQAKKADDSPDAECKVANFLFPSGFTCGGSKVCIDKLTKIATEAKALQARIIKTGGAFHTKYMSPAQVELSSVLDEMLPKMKAPRCAIYFNITGKRIAAGTDPEKFIDLMKQQLVSEVLWCPTIQAMVMDGIKEFFELGPMKQLKAMIKRIDLDSFKKTENVAV